MTTKKLYRRKPLNFSINPGIQLRMIGLISGILFICLLISSAVYFQFANQEIGASFKLFHIKARNFLDMLLPVIATSFVVSLLCGVVASLFFPKNYAGTLYRLETDLKKILNTSDLSLQITLRDGDQAQSLATQVNALLADLRQRVAQSQQALAHLDELCEPGVTLSADALQPIRDQLQQQIGTLKH